MTLYEQLAKTRVLPLYTATDLTYLPVVESLLIEHELPFIEVTFRSDLALAAIEELSQSGKLIVGAGTVRTLEQAKAAVEKGRALLFPLLLYLMWWNFVLPKTFQYFQEQLPQMTFNEQRLMAYQL